MNQSTILVVDDERAVRTALNVNLAKKGLDVQLADSTQSALKLLNERTFDLVLSDVKMPDGTGLELLIKIRDSWPETQVVIMTGFGSITDAVTAMKAGAADYIIKPIERDELFIILERALERKALRSEVRKLRAEVTERYGFHNLIGTTGVMKSIYTQISAVADTSATVLLEGPTGTGKELLAHALHYRSHRSRGPFVRVNCASLPESLLESELFGHEKGAFSGAIRQHLGKFEQANGGTLLLDEIGETNLAMQAKLLRVLENGEMQRVGGQKTISLDVRIVTSTNRELKQEVQQGRFRADLYYRLNVVKVKVPSLQERKEDIPLLVEHFIRHFTRDSENSHLEVDPNQLKALIAYDWPGNVRELKHTIERAIILLPGGPTIDIPNPIDQSDEISLPGSNQPPPCKGSLSESLGDYERHLIIDALKQAKGVQAQAARALGLSRSNLNYRIQRLGIIVKEISYE
jgi:DNA-binding NtrC family response regulator